MNEDTPSPLPAFDESGPPLPETSAFATAAAPERVAPPQDEWRETVRETRRRAADGGFTAACSDWVRCKPVTAIAMAFGAGLLVGRIGR